MKFCINCSYYDSGDCFRISKYNPVTGEQITIESIPAIEYRSRGGQCGPNGLLFEQKDNNNNLIKSKVAVQKIDSSKPATKPN